jgi:hypothetical protein
VPGVIAGAACRLETNSQTPALEHNSSSQLQFMALKANSTTAVEAESKTRDARVCVRSGVCRVSSKSREINGESKEENSRC